MKIINHLIESQSVEIKEISKHSGAFKQDLPKTIILHYTAGGSSESAINTFTNPNVKASAHLVIDWDGIITQLIPFNKIAWHAGRSSRKDKAGMNKYSIGIEIVNPGHLKKVGNQFQSWFGKMYEEQDVLSAVQRNETKERYWHKFTEEQITTVRNICQLLIDEYGIKEILGHEEVSPGRKTDPGPAFPLDKLRETIFNDRENESNADESNVGFVNVDELNIRSGAGVNYEKVSSPLKEGTEVEILSKEGSWYKVSTEIKGWVHSDYIKRI